MCVGVCHVHTRMIVYVLMYVDVMIHISYIYLYIYTYVYTIYINIYIIHINNIYVYIYYTSYIKRLLLFGYLPFFDVLFPLSWRKALVDEGWSWIYIIHMLYSIALVMVVRTPVILGYTVQRYTEYIFIMYMYL